MPQLYNTKHELFALGIAKGLAQREAYVNAGIKGKSVDSGASRLIKRPDIIERIAELKDELKEKAVRQVSVSKDQAVGILMSIVAKGLNLGKEKRDTVAVSGLNAARAAIVEVAKLEGFYPEKIPANSIVVNPEGGSAKAAANDPGGPSYQQVVININGRDAEL